MVRKIGFCQKAEPCCWPGLKNEKNGEITAKLGGVTADAEIHHFEPAANSNKWRMELFKNGGDIYCMSARQMFKVPVEKHGVNRHLRQKGKIAELTCIAAGELVHTRRGMIPIEKICPDDLLWEGESWVHHDGLIFRGLKEVISYDGLTATGDHQVYVKGHTEPVLFGDAAYDNLPLVRVGRSRASSAPFRCCGVMPVYDILNAGPHHRFAVS